MIADTEQTVLELGIEPGYKTPSFAISVWLLSPPCSTIFAYVYTYRLRPTIFFPRIDYEAATSGCPSGCLRKRRVRTTTKGHHPGIGWPRGRI